MKMSESLEERIDKMQESKNKEIWNELKESDNVYVTIPTVDTIDYIYDIRKGYFKLRPLESLKYAQEYYAHVQEVYNKYDFILNRGFFESNIHVNEIDTIHITDTTRNKTNKICESLDSRIKKLEEQSIKKQTKTPHNAPVTLTIQGA